jgi:hypothetical protein
MLLKLNLLLVAILFSYASAADPISCKAVQYTSAFNDNQQFNVTSSANFSLTINNGTTYVTATNISVINLITNEQATGVCYYGVCCNITTTNSCTFDVRDTFVLLYANFTNNVTFTTFQGLVADDGTFSTTKLFSSTNMCLNSFSNDSGTISNHSICCTSSTLAPVAAINAPQCKKFKSRTTIYNINDHFSIFATTQLIWEIIGRTIVPSGFTDTAQNYFACYFDHSFFNLPLACDELLTVHNNITMSNDTDAKTLVSVFYLPKSLTIAGINGILTARLLYRNNQLLMSEGTPFTPQNNCWYSNAPWYPSPANHSTSVSFCCQEFEN